MKNKFSIAMSLALMVTMMVTSMAFAGAPSAPAFQSATPTITSDLPDYAPGETVNLFGAGWQAGESVHIYINDDVGASWSRSVDVTAGSDGKFTDTFQLPNWFVATYSVTATGAVSGTVTTTFTDGNTTSVSGNVTDSVTSLPISGATVSCTTFSGCNANISTTTDGSGNYVFSNATTKLTFAGNGPVSLTLTASKSGYTSASQTLTGVDNGDSFSNVNFSLTPSDTTPPVITFTGTAPNANGWNNTNVTVSWSVTDLESGIASSSGCSTTTLTAETSGTVVTCSATNGAGLSNSASVTVKIDKTAPNAPTASASTSDGAYTAGTWTNKDVTVSYASNGDAGTVHSGVASCTANQVFASETAGTNTSGTCTDAAGNISTATNFGPIKIDKTAPNAPIASASTSDGAYTAGTWTNKDVTVSYAGNGDAGTVQSGVASCTANQVFASETAGTNTSGTCTDAAGNTSAAASFGPIKIDKTAPTASASAAPAPNLNGWNNTNVTVTFTGNDGTGSGINFCDAPVVLSSDAAGQSASGDCTDLAGNVSATATASGINIDKTAPTFGSCPAGGPFILNSGFQSVGPISVDASISGLNTSTLSGSVDTSSIGLKTVNFSAVDNADNQASKPCSYSVIYNWTGFFQPIDNLPVLNRVKAGSAIPVKFSLSGYQGLNIFTAGYPVSTWTVCGTITTDDVETTLTAGSSSLSYDATADQYVYVWKTDKTWASSCRTLTVKLADGTIHQANFNFTR